MKKTEITMALTAAILAAVLFLPSCGKGKAKKNAATETTAATATAPAGASPSAPAAAGTKRSPAELLAAIPCKLTGKKGIFAVFPDNPAAGQICFSLAPSAGSGADVRAFDIQGGGMHVIGHDTTDSPAADLKIVKLQGRGGKPCVEKSCVSDAAASSENYSDPGDPGWRYTIITAAVTPDFAVGTGAYFGVAVKSGGEYVVYDPVFE